MTRMAAAAAGFLLSIANPSLEVTPPNSGPLNSGQFSYRTFTPAPPPADHPGTSRATAPIDLRDHPDETQAGLNPGVFGPAVTSRSDSSRRSRPGWTECPGASVRA